MNSCCIPICFKLNLHWFHYYLCKMDAQYSTWHEYQLSHFHLPELSVRESFPLVLSIRALPVTNSRVSRYGNQNYKQNRIPYSYVSLMSMSKSINWQTFHRIHNLSPRTESLSVWLFIFRDLNISHVYIPNICSYLFWLKYIIFLFSI